MSVVEITIRQKLYHVECAPGQESQLRELAGVLDARVSKISEQLEKGTSDSVVLVMAGLMLEDEIQEERRKFERYRNASASQALDERSAELRKVTEAEIEQIEQDAADEANRALRDAILGVADYVEKIVEKVEANDSALTKGSEVVSEGAAEPVTS